MFGGPPFSRQDIRPVCVVHFFLLYLYGEEISYVHQCAHIYLWIAYPHGTHAVNMCQSMLTYGLFEESRGAVKCTHAHTSALCCWCLQALFTNQNIATSFADRLFELDCDLQSLKRVKLFCVLLLFLLHCSTMASHGALLRPVCFSEYPALLSEANLVLLVCGHKHPCRHRSLDY
jgi:hypothetical protein